MWHKLVGPPRGDFEGRSRNSKIFLSFINNNLDNQRTRFTRREEYPVVDETSNATGQSQPPKVPALHYIDKRTQSHE
jgi:hypothetical protein